LPLPGFTPANIRDFSEIGLAALKTLDWHPETGIIWRLSTQTKRVLNLWADAFLASPQSKQQLISICF
jgi:hypothetical protein